MGAHEVPAQQSAVLVGVNTTGQRYKEGLKIGTLTGRKRSLTTPPSTFERAMDIEQQSTPKPVLRTNVGPHWSLNSAVSRTPCALLTSTLAHARAPP